MPENTVRTCECGPRRDVSRDLAAIVITLQEVSLQMTAQPEARIEARGGGIQPVNSDAVGVEGASLNTEALYPGDRGLFFLQVPPHPVPGYKPDSASRTDL